MEASERILQVVSYNHETGEFRWPVTSGKGLVGQIAGGMHKSGHMSITFKGFRVYAHRLAWRIHYGNWPLNQIDHINGNKADNRISNLRDVTSQTNAQNIRIPHSDNQTGFLGISRSRGKFMAQIMVAGMKKTLGRFKTPEDAAKAYLDAKRTLHVGCTI